MARRSKNKKKASRRKKEVADEATAPEVVEETTAPEDVEQTTAPEVVKKTTDADTGEETDPETRAKENEPGEDMENQDSNAEAQLFIDETATSTSPDIVQGPRIASHSKRLKRVKRGQHKVVEDTEEEGEEKQDQQDEEQGEEEQGEVEQGEMVQEDEDQEGQEQPGNDEEPEHEDQEEEEDEVEAEQPVNDEEPEDEDQEEEEEQIEEEQPGKDEEAEDEEQEEDEEQVEDEQHVEDEESGGEEVNENADPVVPSSSKASSSKRKPTSLQRAKQYSKEHESSTQRPEKPKAKKSTSALQYIPGKKNRKRKRASSRPLRNEPSPPVSDLEENEIETDQSVKPGPSSAKKKTNEIVKKARKVNRVPIVSTQQARYEEKIRRLTRQFEKDVDRGYEEPDEEFVVGFVYDKIEVQGNTQYIVTNKATKSIQTVDKHSVTDPGFIAVMDKFLADRDEAIRLKKKKIPGVRYFTKQIAKHYVNPDEDSLQKLADLID